MNDRIKELALRLTQYDFDALETLKKLLGEDLDGLKILEVIDLATQYTHALYQRKGIDDVIFKDTMKAISRFEKEYEYIHGHPGFDRDFWILRQLSLRLFRIGELEYEMIQEKISIHIPSDAKLSLDACSQSIEEAKKFFKKYYPSYQDAPYVCSSWLMSPDLKDLLSKQSNILQFQTLFDIQRSNKVSLDCIGWVFKRFDSNIQDYPEDTSLQRNMKEYLLSGKMIHEGIGYLKYE